MDRLSNMAITGAMATILVLVASAILLPYAVSHSAVKWNGAIEKRKRFCLIRRLCTTLNL